MKQVMIFLALLFPAFIAKSQMYSPVKWSYAAKKTNSQEVVVYIKGKIEQGWHIFSVNQPNGGPLKTSFNFKLSNNYSLTGKTSEPQPIKQYDDTFKMDIFYFEDEVVFQQKIKVKKPTSVIEGKIEYMACTDGMCTPPLDINFSIPVKP